MVPRQVPKVLPPSWLPPTAAVRQPLENQALSGSPPVPVLEDSRAPLAAVVLNHSSADSVVPAAAKYPPGMVTCEPLPAKVAGVPSGNPVGPAAPSVTLE